MDIKKELENNQIILVVIPSVEYNQIISNTAKALAKKSSVSYVTLNKTYDSLKELFSKKGVNMGNIVFIDAISKTIKKTADQTDSCYYLSSPGALTEISLAMTKFLRHKFNYMVFDSVNSLLVYQKRETVIKFTSSVINKIRSGNTKAVFYAVETKEQADLIKQFSMSVDKVIFA